MKTPRRTSLPRILTVTLLLLTAGGLSLVQRHRSGPGIPPAAKRGQSRELTFALLNGETWRLSADRGHVVAVNLWATWCAPCREETPMLVRVQTDLAAKGFRVIGVSLDTTADKATQVRSFQQAFHIPYPLAFPGALSQIESGLDGIPTTLLFDRQGRAAKIYVGELRESFLRADVTQLLEDRETSEEAHTRH